VVSAHAQSFTFFAIIDTPPKVQRRSTVAFMHPRFNYLHIVPLNLFLSGAIQLPKDKNLEIFLYEKYIYLYLPVKL